MASTNTSTSAPLRNVVASEQRPNYRIDTLECGHTVADYDNHERKRRRCAACQRGSQNAELLRPDTFHDRRRKSRGEVYRGRLIIEGGGVWWACNHEHERALDAYDCALAARDEVRAGVLMHRVTGRAGG